jgi:hypothetical protein
MTPAELNKKIRKGMVYYVNRPGVTIPRLPRDETLVIKAKSYKGKVKLLTEDCGWVESGWVRKQVTREMVELIAEGPMTWAFN